jgi:hypothetical protein
MKAASCSIAPKEAVAVDPGSVMWPSFGELGLREAEMMKGGT